MIANIIAAILSYFIGIFGWTQIIGSIQNLRERTNLIFTFLIWVVIMVVCFDLAVKTFDASFGMIFGYLTSFIQVKKQGNIK